MSVEAVELWPGRTERTRKETKKKGHGNRNQGKSRNRNKGLELECGLVQKPLARLKSSQQKPALPKAYEQTKRGQRGAGTAKMTDHRRGLNLLPLTWLPWWWWLWLCCRYGTMIICLPLLYQLLFVVFCCERGERRREEWNERGSEGRESE